MRRSQTGGEVHWSLSEPNNCTVLDIDPKAAYFLLLSMNMDQIIKRSIFNVVECLHLSQAGGEVHWNLNGFGRRSEIRIFLIIDEHSHLDRPRLVLTQPNNFQIANLFLSNNIRSLFPGY